jgi:hypothetical protein
MVLQRLGPTLRRAVVAAIDACTTGSDRADVYHSPPSLLLHVRYGQLGDDERTSKVDIDSVIPLVEIKLEDIADPLPVASIGYQNIGMLAMRLFDLVEQALEVSFFGDIALVG